MAKKPSDDNLFGALPEQKPAPKSSPKSKGEDNHTAASIEVLEGLEPVRRRPGMYIGGTDEKALHHLFAEVLDNCMDEAVAGHATWIDVSYTADGYLTVTDNGRGIPPEPHPKFKDKSTIEVVMTVLHAGGKFDSGAYETSGGLHGVGVSVVNALSEHLIVEVARGGQLYRQEFQRGKPLGKLQELGKVSGRRGTMVKFLPDQQIFGKGNIAFSAARLYKMARSESYLFGGVEIRWRCDAAQIKDKDIPEEAVFHFPGGLKDFLEERLDGIDTDHKHVSPLVIVSFGDKAALLNDEVGHRRIIRYHTVGMCPTIVLAFIHQVVVKLAVERPDTWRDHGHIGDAARLCEDGVGVLVRQWFAIAFIPISRSETGR